MRPVGAGPKVAPVEAGRALPASPEAPPALATPLGPSASIAGLSPNHRIQLVYDVKEATAARLRALGPPAPGSAGAMLAGVFEDVDRGRIPREVFNRVFLGLITGLGEDRSPSELAARLLARTPGQLKVALGELTRARAEATRPAAVAEVEAPGARTARLGQAIAEVLLFAEPEPRLEALFAAAPRLPPFVLGLLAEATGITDPARFLPELRAASAEDLADVLGFVERSVSRYALLEHLSPRASAGPTGEGAIDGAARMVSLITGQDEALLRGRMVERHRTATELFGQLEARLVEVFGAAGAGAIVEGLGRDRAIAELADPRDGVKVYTRIEARDGLAIKRRRLHLEAATVGLGRLADELAGELAGRPELASVREVFERLPPAAARLLGVELFLRYAGVSRGELPVAGFLFRVASEVGTRVGQGAVLDRLAADLAADPRGFAADLAGLAADLEGMAHAIERAREADRRRAADAVAGELVLDPGVARRVERHLAGAYPAEGLGYLAAQGDRQLFLPVRSALEGELAHVAAIPHPDDVARWHDRIAALDLRFVGLVHSHPDTTPVFSDGDLETVRPIVAAQPGFRTIVVGVGAPDAGRGRFTWASFASRPDGQVEAEDTVRERRGT